MSVEKSINDRIIDDVMTHLRGSLQADKSTLDFIQDTWRLKLDKLMTEESLEPNKAEAKPQEMTSKPKEASSKTKAMISKMIKTKEISFKTKVMTPKPNMAKPKPTVMRLKVNTSASAKINQIDGIDGISSSEDSESTHSSDEDDDLETTSEETESSSDQLNKEENTDQNELLNSGDDDPDDDPYDGIDDPFFGNVTNIITCQYSKILRRRNTWKLELKNGMMTLNGNEYVFSEAVGVADW